MIREMHNTRKTRKWYRCYKKWGNITGMEIKLYILYHILDSHGGDYRNYCLLRNNALWSGRLVPEHTGHIPGDSTYT
jgi:hypothetical protein